MFFINNNSNNTLDKEIDIILNMSNNKFLYFEVQIIRKDINNIQLIS